MSYTMVGNVDVDDDVNVKLHIQCMHACIYVV